MLVLPFVEVCSRRDLRRLDPLIADKCAFFDEIDVDLLDIPELDEERVECAQVVQLVRDIVHDYAESFLFLHRQGRVGAARRTPGHLSLKGLNLLQFGESLTLGRGLGAASRVISRLSGL